MRVCMLSVIFCLGYCDSRDLVCIYAHAYMRACVQFRLSGGDIRRAGPRRRRRTSGDSLVYHDTTSPLRTSRSVQTSFVHNITGASTRRQCKTNRLQAHVPVSRHQRVPTADHEHAVRHRIRLETGWRLVPVPSYYLRPFCVYARPPSALRLHPDTRRGARSHPRTLGNCGRTPPRRRRRLAGILRHVETHQDLLQQLRDIGHVGLDVDEVLPSGGLHWPARRDILPALGRRAHQDDCRDALRCSRSNASLRRRRLQAQYLHQQRPSEASINRKTSSSHWCSQDIYLKIEAVSKAAGWRPWQGRHYKETTSQYHCSHGRSQYCRCEGAFYCCLKW